MIRRLIYWVLLLLFVWVPMPIPGEQPIKRFGDRIPPQAQKDGFWFQQSVLAEYG